MGLKFLHGIRADLIVENSLLVELKSVQTLAPAHAKQVLTDLSRMEQQPFATGSNQSNPSRLRAFA
jgi:GxxExxY protein